MADGRWSMTERELNSTACGFDLSEKDKLPNYKQYRYVDDRKGQADRVCAFCGSSDVERGFGGYGSGFLYNSVQCNACGGQTNFVTKDEVGKFFPEEDVE